MAAAQQELHFAEKQRRLQEAAAAKAEAAKAKAAAQSSELEAAEGEEIGLRLGEDGSGAVDDSSRSGIQRRKRRKHPTVSKEEFAMIIESVTGEAPPSEHVDTVFSLVDADVRLAPTPTERQFTVPLRLLSDCVLQNSGRVNYKEVVAFFGIGGSHRDWE